MGLGYGYNPGIDSDLSTFNSTDALAGVTLLPVDRVVPKMSDRKSSGWPVCMHFGGSPTGFSDLHIDHFPVRA